MARAKQKQPIQETSQQSKVRGNNSLRLKIEHLKTVYPITSNQKQFFEAYKNKEQLIILHGAPGTGKTFIACYKALEEVMQPGNQYDKVIIVRSAVQGRELGHTPGTVDEKMSMYEAPYIQICANLFGRPDAYSRLCEQGYIEFVSTSFLRGSTFDNCVIIVDEFQNMTEEEIFTIITRVGHDSKIIFCGDIRQTDLKKKTDVSGLSKFFEITALMKSLKKIEFTVDDIVRSGLVKEFIMAKIQYEDSLK